MGSKIEHNSYTGFEFEPSAQLVWAPTPHHTFWTSAARAIRQPALADIGIRHDVAVYPLNPSAPDDNTFGVTRIVGTPGRQAERMYDFEAGYRTQLSKKLSVDLAVFSSHYFGLQTGEPGGSYFTDVPSPLHEVTITLSDDKAHAENYGGEVSVQTSLVCRFVNTISYSST